MIKKMFSSVLMILFFTFFLAFSMASQEQGSEIVNAIVDSIEESRANQTISQLNKELDSSLNQIICEDDTELFLKIMSLRARLLFQMLLESCARRSCALRELTHVEHKACFSLKNFLYNDNFELYVQAEVAYTEASQVVQRAVNISEVLAANNQILAFKSLESIEIEGSSKRSRQEVNEHYIKNLFCYQNVRKLFASRFLKKECSKKYKKFFFSKKCIEEIGAIYYLADTFFVADFYKTHLKFIYDYMYEAYFERSSGIVNQEIPESIFALDEVANFNEQNETQLKICNLLRLSRFCKVKDLLVTEKTKAIKNASSAKKKTLSREIAHLSRLKIGDKEEQFTQEGCLSLVPEVLSHFKNQAQQELNELLKLDAQYKDYPTFGFTPLKAYFEMIKVQGSGSLALLELPSDLFCEYKKLILDGVECNKFITEIQNTINLLVPPCVGEEIEQKSLLSNKKSKKKGKNKHKKNGKKQQLLEQHTQDLKGSISSGLLECNSDDQTQKNLALANTSDTTEEAVTSSLVESFCSINFIEKVDDIVQEEVEQVPFDLDCAIAENETLICLLDCERAKNGGYQIEVFVYKDKKQMPINPIEELNYSVLKKINNFKDNNHAFTKLVEVYGLYSRTESIEQLPDADVFYGEGYRVKCFYSIPGRLASIGYPIQRASDVGPNGTFEFIVLKRNFEDKGGICVHRFFKPYK